MSERTTLEHLTRMAEHDVKFYGTKLQSELAWLESAIADLRREVERGNIFEQRNLVAKAADVAEVAGKMRASMERLTALSELAP